MPGTPHYGCQAVIKLIITVNEMFLIGNVLISFMFDFVQGPQGPQGVQGERGPIGEGLPGPKVGRWVQSFRLFCLFQRSLSSTFDTLDSTSYPITPKNHSAKTHSRIFPQSQAGMASEGCCRNSLEDSLALSPVFSFPFFHSLPPRET